MSESDSMPVGFRVIPGYPRYAINEHGTVLSVCNVTGRGGRGKDRPWKDSNRVKPTTDKGGYHRVNLSHDGHRRSVPVHKLVLTTFVGTCPPGMECRHIDGNPSNNHISNLAWGTRSENAQDKLLHGTDMRGVKHHNAKLTERDVLEIRSRSECGERGVDLAKEFCVRTTSISAIVLRQTWKHI